MLKKFCDRCGEEMSTVNRDGEYLGRVLEFPLEKMIDLCPNCAKELRIFLKLEEATTDPSKKRYDPFKDLFT